MIPKEDPYILVLNPPITVGEFTQKELTLTEPTAGHVEKALQHNNTASSNIALIAAVSGVPEPIIRKMKFRDYQRAVEYLESFTSGGRATGAN